MTDPLKILLLLTGLMLGKVTCYVKAGKREKMKRCTCCGPYPQWIEDIYKGSSECRTWEEVMKYQMDKYQQKQKCGEIPEGGFIGLKCPNCKKEKISFIFQGDVICFNCRKKKEETK